MLLVSGWAKRAAFLWAVLPPILVCVLDRIIFNSRWCYLLLEHRLVGHLRLAFTPGAHGAIRSLSQLTPDRFLAAPGLWIGLVVAAVFLASAMRLRRYRDPI